MLTAITLLVVSSIPQAEPVLVLPAGAFEAPVIAVMNHYKKGTPIPYMPGAGEPLLDMETPVAKSLLVGR